VPPLGGLVPSTVRWFVHLGGGEEDMADDRLESYLKNLKWLKRRDNVIGGIDLLS
jgi:hypothetical protein